MGRTSRRWRPVVERTHWCPCGHDTASGRYLCINGLIYHPCQHEDCGGVCETTGDRCTSPDCACQGDD